MSFCRLLIGAPLLALLVGGCAPPPNAAVAPQDVQRHQAATQQGLSGAAGPVGVPGAPPGGSMGAPAAAGIPGAPAAAGIPGTPR